NQGYSNPVDDFVTKYKKSCDILEVDYNADKYAIKLAYRKMAKKYHPDINKSENATEKFQEINNAYDFLSDENIKRYNRIENKTKTRENAHEFLLFTKVGTKFNNCTRICYPITI